MNYLPIDYLDTKYSFICFQISNLIQLNNEINQEKLFEIMFNTFSNVINVINYKHLEAVLFRIYDNYSKNLNNNNENFQKFIKILFGYLIKEQNFESFTILIEKVKQDFFKKCFSLPNTLFFNYIALQKRSNNIE